MRHTLLPLKERILLRREYHTRITIVFLFMVCVSILIGISSIWMTYMDVLSAESEMLIKTNSINSDPENLELKEIQKNIAKSLALLDSLNKDKNTVLISDLIVGLINMKGDIKFDNFGINKIATTTYSISIQGFAPNRNSLISFKTNFEKMNPKNKVDLPVSELAKSSNIQFSLQLKQEIQ